MTMKKRLIPMLLALTMMAGCKSTETVIVERTTHDTLWHERMVRDSIYLHDSIHVSEKMKGDTIVLTTERWHTKWLEKTVHDTTRVVTRDTIPQPYPVEVEVEKKLNWWQKTRLHLGDIALMGIIASGGIWLLRRKF